MANGNFDEQATDVLQTVEQVIARQGVRHSILQQTVFLADMTQLDRCRQLMRDFYGPDMPAISYIPQPPCGGKLLAIEALGISQDRGEVEIQWVSPELAIARHNGITWVHCTKMLPPGKDRPMYEAATAELQAVCRLLGSVGMRFGQVVRTWYYLGGIVEPAEKGDSPDLPDDPLTRYQEFNRARTDFFQRVRFRPHCSPMKADGWPDPASTGIGATGADLR